MGVCHHGSNGCNVFLLEVVTLDSFFPKLGISAKVIQIVFWKPLISLMSENSQMSPPHTYTQTGKTGKETRRHTIAKLLAGTMDAGKLRLKNRL